MIGNDINASSNSSVADSAARASSLQRRIAAVLKFFVASKFG
jgi:hypothetical protein